MAALDNGDAIAALLASKTITPIAQLNPDLPAQSSLAVRGEVGITWPYNSVTKTLAFLIAEPDVRLRRAHGQVRIELHGPSAKSLTKCEFGAGDELLLSLDGVEWAKDTSPGRIPGSRIDWQLQFKEKLVLQIKSGESEELKYINVDQPGTEPEPESELLHEPPVEPLIESGLTTPEVEDSPEDIPNLRKFFQLATNEYASPAFVKRARLSYGALYEGVDIFEEDGGVKNKGRKRARFGRNSGAWRYTSQSPSPEPSSPVQDAMEEDGSEDVTSPRAETIDEGCQTVDSEMMQDDPVQTEHDISTSQQDAATSPIHNGSAFEGHGLNSPAREQDEPPVYENLVHSTQVSPETNEATPATSEAFTPGPPPFQLALDPDQPISHPDASSSLSAEGLETSHNNQFDSSKPATSAYSMFGTTAQSRAEPTMSIADQVRFDFSHVPEADYSAAVSQHTPRGLGAEFNTHETYPASYPDIHAPTNYSHMDPYMDSTGRQQYAAHDRDMATHPPLVESFGHGQWEMATQSPFYNPVEGGHFGADALEEGSRITSEQPSLHSTEISPDSVPQGYAAYGGNEVPYRQPEETQGHQSGIGTGASGIAYTPQTETSSQVEVVDLSDDDGEADAEADAEADREAGYDLDGPVEDGDYDQRNYDSVSDDEEGLSEQEEEVEQEVSERYGDGEIYEDGESWDEDGLDEIENEEGYDEDDEEVEGYSEESEDLSDDDGYDHQIHLSRFLSQSRPVAPSAPREPVVISLLSDSEDEGEPVPAPAPPPASAPVAAPVAQEAPASEDSSSEEDDDDDSSVESDDSEPVPTSGHGEHQQPHDEIESSQGDVAEEQNNFTKTALENTDVVDFAGNKDLDEQARGPEADPDGGQESFLSSAAEEESEVFEYHSENVNDAASEPESEDAEGEEDIDEETSEPLGIVDVKTSGDKVENTEALGEVDAEEPIEVAIEPSTVEAEIEREMEPVPDHSQDNQEGPLERDAKKEERLEVPTSVPDLEDEELSGYVTDDKNSSFATQIDMVDEMDVREEDQAPETASQIPTAATQNYGGATDDKTMSFATQIDAEINAGEPDEEMGDVSEDDVMADGDTPVEHREETIITQQTWETEDVEIIDVVDEDDDDVAMIDAATPVLGAGLEDDDDVDMLQAQESGESRGESEVAPPGTVITEIISEVIITEEITTIVEPVEQPEDLSMNLEKPAEVPNEQMEEPQESFEQQTTKTAPNVFSPPLTNSFASQPPDDLARKGHQPSTPMQSQPVEAEVPLEPDGDSEEESFSDAVEQLGESVDGTRESQSEALEVDEKAVDQIITVTQDEISEEEVSLVEVSSPVEEVVPQSSGLSPPPEDLKEDEADAPSVAGESGPEEWSSPMAYADGTVQSKRATVQDVGEKEDQTVEPEAEPETPLQVTTKPVAVEDTEDQATIATPSTEAHQSPEPEPEADRSVSLARQAVPKTATRRSKSKKSAALPPEQPTRISPRLTRGRSNSVHTIATDEGDSSINLAKGALGGGTPSKDISVNLAKGALDSLSKQRPETPTTSSSPALKTDLIKRLRTELLECINLKSLRNHNDKYPNIVAIVTTEPSPPARAKGGPREYSMTFHVTDPSIAPKDVVEIQLYRPHKDHLPILRIGDAVLLQKVQVKALSKKGHGLRSGQETAWAVFDEDEGPPQIKGLVVEDWERYRGYMTSLREWWRGLSEGDKGKIEERWKKMKEG